MLKSVTLWRWIICLFIIIFAKENNATESNVQKHTIFDLGSPYFNQVGDSTALPVITSIVEDSQGFLWLGTQNGLYRYDGIQFKPYTADKSSTNGLSDNYVYRLWQAPDDKLWIGARSGGITILDTATNRTTQLNPIIKDSPNTALVSSITGTASGDVFIATAEGMIWTNSTGESPVLFKSVPGCELPDSVPKSLVLTETGILWLIESKQVCEVHIDITQKTLLGRQRQVFPGGELSSAYLDGHLLWLGSRGQGIYKYNTENDTLKKIKSTVSADIDSLLIFDFYEQSDDTLWVATYLGGILVVDKHSDSVIRSITHNPSNSYSLGGNNPSAFLKDRSGILWVGTWGTGLFKLNTVNQSNR